MNSDGSSDPTIPVSADIERRENAHRIGRLGINLEAVVVAIRPGTNHGVLCDRALNLGRLTGNRCHEDGPKRELSRRTDRILPAQELPAPRLVRRVQIDLNAGANGHPVLIVGRVILDTAVRVRTRGRPVAEVLLLSLVVFSGLLRCSARQRREEQPSPEVESQELLQREVSATSLQGITEGAPKNQNRPQGMRQPYLMFHCSVTDRCTRALCVTWNKAPGAGGPRCPASRPILDRR